MTRRHRIHEEEVPEVTKGLVLKLRQHLETKKDLIAATICFRCLYRIEEHRVGRPDYPEPVTWSLIENWINNHYRGRGAASATGARWRGGPTDPGGVLT